MSDQRFSIPSLIGGPSRYSGDIPQVETDPLLYELGGLNRTLKDRVHAGFGEDVGIIKTDNHLSDTGKAVRIEQAARKSLAEVDRLMKTSPAKWQGLADALAAKLLAKLPGNPADDAMAAQIRDYVRTLPNEQRTRFLQDRLEDAATIGAVLAAPPYLSGLLDTSYDLIRSAAVERVAGEDAHELRRIESTLAIVRNTAKVVRRTIAEAAGIRLPDESDAITA